MGTPTDTAELPHVHRDPMAVYQLRCPSCRYAGSFTGHLRGVDSVGIRFDKNGNPNQVAPDVFPPRLQCQQCQWQGPAERFFIGNQWEDPEVAARVAGALNRVAMMVEDGCAVPVALRAVADEVAPQNLSPLDR